MTAPILMGLDYDGTYTADPLLWDAFIALARHRGHQVVCVTGRLEPPASHEHAVPCEVVCCGAEYKRHAAFKAGYNVQIWIDDMPEMIGPTRILDWSQ